MRRLPAALAVTTLLLLGSAWAAAVEVNPPLATAKLTIGPTLQVTVELARTMQEKIRGLSGRSGLAPGHGMLFVYERPQPIGIWMKDMRFSLDILWIGGGRIVHIERDAPPLKPGGREVVYTAVGNLVLEVPAGFAKRHRLRVGDPARVALP